MFTEKGLNTAECLLEDFVTIFPCERVYFSGPYIRDIYNISCNVFLPLAYVHVKIYDGNPQPVCIHISVVNTAIHWNGNNFKNEKNWN